MNATMWRVGMGTVDLPECDMDTVELVLRGRVEELRLLNGKRAWIGPATPGLQPNFAASAMAGRLVLGPMVSTEEEVAA